jgi:hypothetical protein
MNEDELIDDCELNIPYDDLVEIPWVKFNQEDYHE